MSSAPHNERPWAPAELDALEDALDRLGAPQLPATLSAEQAQRIGGRLASYRAIAALSRELLSSHAAPPSAIAAALAEARAAAVIPAPPDAAPEAPRASWWSRARRVWVLPTLASAGVGVLVVVLSVTRDASAPATIVAERATSEPRVDAVVSTPAATPAEAPSSGLAMIEPTPATAEGASDRGAAAQPIEELQATRGRLRERDGDDTRDASKTVRADEPTEDEAERKRSEPMAADEPARPSTRAPAADPKPAPAPKKEAPSQGPAPSKPATGGVPGSIPGGANSGGPSPAALGDLLLRADRARRGGDCAAARRDYETVMSRGDGRQRARAKAGTALCLEQDGADARAGDLIAGARLDDPAIDAWLASERARAGE